MTDYNYKEIYKIIKENGPISFSEIGQCLQHQCNSTKESRLFPRHSEIAGYVSNLSKTGRIKNVAQDKSGIRKTPPQKVWVAVDVKNLDYY